MSSASLTVSETIRLPAAQRLVELHVPVRALELAGDLEADALVAHGSVSVPWTSAFSVIGFVHAMPSSDRR